MKFLSRHSKHNALVELSCALETSFQTEANFSDKDFGSIAYSAEALKNAPLTEQCDKASTISASLEASGLRSFLEEKAQVSAIQCKEELERVNESIEHAMEAAMATAVALIDPERYQGGYLAATPKAEAGAVVLTPTVAGHASTYTYSAEGFDNFKFDNFRSSAIISNALNAMTNSFQAVWFKPVIVSPSEHGAEVDIRIPYVFNSKTRNADGSAYEPEHRLVIDAYRDRTILANTGNKVFANAAVINPAFIAPVGVVPNRAVTLNSTVFNTRPLVLGQNIDILAGSSHAGLASGDKQNEQDTLSPTAKVGKLYISVDDGTDTSVVIIDTAALNGSLFVPGQVGDTQELILNMNSVALADETTPSANGTALTDIAGLVTGVGNAAAAEPLKLGIHVKLSGNFWPRRGNIEVSPVSDTPVEIVSAQDKDGQRIDDASLTALKAALTVAIVAYEPDLSRTNSNLRDKGLAVDMGSTIKYKLGVPMLSPISSATPISVDGGGAGMDGLQMVRRARENNIAVQTLFDYESIIKACNGQKTQHAGIGSHLVTPTYIYDTVDVGNKVVIEHSRGARDDLRAAIGVALEQVSSRLLEESGYLAVLDALYGTTAGFEFIIATSPRLHSLLMTSGDARLLGANRRFTIVSNHDDDFINKVYISVRRPSEANVDPLSFAAHVSMPPLIYKSPVTVRDGSHSLETQLIPRDLFVGTCPLLARVDITGLDALFTD